jgi:hypothetical protein
MRIVAVPYLLCMLAAGTLLAADSAAENAGTPGGGKAGAPPSPSTDVEGFAAGATLGLPRVTVEEKTEGYSGKRFTLHIPIKARAKVPIDVGNVAIHVLFYDMLDGEKVVKTTANVRFRWARPPADWVDSDNEELTVDYDLPLSDDGHRKYFGYIVRVYYKKQLQAELAEPRRLATEFPAQSVLPAPSGEHPATKPVLAVRSKEIPNQSSADFTKYARALRESAMLNIEPVIMIPTGSRVFGGRYPWKTGIVTTVFYVGSANHNASAWDTDWKDSFGGVDNPDPAARKGYIPAGFIPRQNPFYIGLPYNDVSGNFTKPESALVIPWFRDAYKDPGDSVCRDRWVAIRNAAGKVCFAQWSDCGPFRTDHFQYVFGNERPKPNSNQGAGLEVSPAVRDYLGLARTDVTDWKFVSFHEVQQGPWGTYGDNNQFVIEARRKAEHPDAPPAPAPGVRGPSDGDK